MTYFSSKGSDGGERCREDKWLPDASAWQRQVPRSLFGRRYAGVSEKGQGHWNLVTGKCQLNSSVGEELIADHIRCKRHRICLILYKEAWESGRDIWSLSGGTGGTFTTSWFHRTFSDEDLSVRLDLRVGIYWILVEVLDIYIGTPYTRGCDYSKLINFFY